VDSEAGVISDQEWWPELSGWSHSIFTGDIYGKSLIHSCCCIKFRHRKWVLCIHSDLSKLSQPDLFMDEQNKGPPLFILHCFFSQICFLKIIYGRIQISVFSVNSIITLFIAFSIQIWQILYVLDKTGQMVMIPILTLVLPFCNLYSHK